jgi:glycosyltransferase involved in cell wall biosynthesis
VVLQVLPALNDGGVEQSAVEMALYLKARKWAVSVASAGGRKEATLERHGITHHKLRLNSKNPVVILANAVRLVGIVKKEGVTLLHARSRAPAWSAWLAAKLCGAAFVTTFHGTYGLNGGPLKRFYNSVMLRGPIAIANSQFIKAHIVENYGYPADKIVVAPRGIEPGMWDATKFDENEREVVRREIGVEEDVPLIMMVGRLTRWKGHELLLHALAQVKDKKWVAAFAGGGDARDPYVLELGKLTAALGLSERVRWLGSRQDVPRLLSAANLAISASVKAEAFGRVAVEAMAMGVPVVATALGGSRETVVDGKTGWLVQPTAKAGSALHFGEFTPQAMAEKIAGALRNPKRLATMGQAARKHVLQNFTVEQCCTQELLAYKRVLGMR